jgi:AcrR family transcriptional regulator
LLVLVTRRPTANAGRPRDATIDDAVLAAARRHLAQRGYDAMSVAAIAVEAGTTRQAVYRRWPTKADLATAAIAALADTADAAPTAAPFADLVAELTAFQQGVSRPDGVSMVGTMLQDTTDPELRRLYRQRVVRPRRARLRAVLQRGITSGALDADADLEVAIAMLTGSWYARALAGDWPPERWAHRAASLAWRALGGTREQPP